MPEQKNLTLSIDAALLEQVRRIALEEKTTVNAMVRDLLARKATASTTQARRSEARRSMAELARQTSAAPTPDFHFNRTDLYAERVSGHERDHLRSHSGDDGAGKSGKGG